MTQELKMIVDQINDTLARDRAATHKLHVRRIRAAGLNVVAARDRQQSPPPHDRTRPTFLLDGGQVATET